MANNVITVSEKTIPILCDCDVVVAGGGTAGFSAAVSAARAGAKVVIIEKSNVFGGLWTNGLVLRLYGTHAFAQGKRKNYFGGIGKEVINRIDSFDHGVNFFGDDGFEPTPDPEIAIYVMDQIIQEEHVTVLFNVYVADVVNQEESIKALICDSKQGRFAITAKSFVDATGDCDILAMTSNECSIVTRYNIGLNHILSGIKDLPESVIDTVYGNVEYMANLDTTWVNMDGEKCDWTDLFQFSKLEMEHRKKIWKQYAKLKEISGSNEIYISKTATQMGTRVTRLPHNDHTFQYEDAILRPESLQPIGVSGWANYEMNYKKQVSAYQIPYSTIRPESFKNLWVAGRCVNADEVIINSLRLIPNCFITGQAAGVAAAICAIHGYTGDQLPYRSFEKELKRQKVILNL